MYFPALKDLPKLCKAYNIRNKNSIILASQSNINLSHSSAHVVVEGMILPVLRCWFLLLLLCFGVRSLEKDKVRYVYLCHSAGAAGNPYERAWTTEYLLQGCEQEGICWKDLVKAFEAGDHTTVQPFMQPDTVYFVQLDATKLYTWYVGTVIEMAKQYNRSISDFALVHMSDNQKNPHIPLYASFYRGWKHVFRNYYWNDPVLLPLFAEGTLSYFPLGYSSHMHSATRHNAQLTPANRQHVVTFVGNKKTGNVRRLANINEISAVTGINVTGQVNHFEFGFGSPKNYRSLMKNSKFCVTLQGQFVECYRMYDALEVGCIVVMIDEFNNFNYNERHLEQLAPIFNFSWTDSTGHKVSLLEAGHTKDKFSVSTSTRTYSTETDSATEVHTVYETKTDVVPGSGMATTLLRRKSYLPFNNGGGLGGAEGVSIVPFVYMRSVSEFAEVLHTLLADETLMAHIQRESSVWWRQMKEHYRREMKNKLCVPGGS